MVPEANLREAQARQIKATAYASMLRRHDATALEAARLPEEGWEKLRQLLAALEDEKWGRRSVPSPETRAVVVTLLEAMEAAALRCPPDPFAGLS